jgi:hypothetical protein
MGRIKNANNNNRKQIDSISFSSRVALAATAFIILSVLLSSAISSNQTFMMPVFAQTTPAAAAAAAATASSIDTFDMSGTISSLVFGVAENTKTIDITKVQKFILSGHWTMNVNKGELTNFVADFYTGHVNGANNHTHQLINFRVNNNSAIKLTSDRSTSISGILNVETNGKEAWNNVNATIVISKGRTIAINLDDNDTQRHFMGQQIYGVVEKTKII